MVGRQKPRIASVPAFERSRGKDAIELMARAGKPLDSWQKKVLIGASGERDDGKWAAPEIALNIPRQNGKGAVLEARTLAGIFAWGERLIIHSAHEFATATEAFMRMEELLESSDDLRREVKSINRSHGHEGFRFKSGQRIKYRTRTGGGGRGFTCDGALILDEAMILKETFMGALDFTQSGRSMEGNPQTWYAGSAVDQLVHEHGIVFASIRERGLEGQPGLAYFEWSASVDLPLDQVDDEIILTRLLELAAEANPGLGIRISPEWVEGEFRRRALRTFCVERLGMGDYPATDGDNVGPIAIADWDELADPASKINGPVAFAFDVTPDRRSASIAAAGERQDGLAHVELIDRGGKGTAWIVNRLVELCACHKHRMVVCDGASPAASLVPELEERGITVELLDARDHANACGLIFDQVEQGRLRHLGTPELRSAIKGSTARPLGEAWAWSRKNSAVDISPLVACTLALWGALTVPKVEVFAGAW